MKNLTIKIDWSEWKLSERIVMAILALLGMVVVIEPKEKDKNMKTMQEMKIEIKVISWIIVILIPFLCFSLALLLGGSLWVASQIVLLIAYFVFGTLVYVEYFKLQ